MNYNIICHDGKQIEISEKQKDRIYELSVTGTKVFKISDEIISFSNIARIEKSNAPQYQDVKQIPGETVSYSKTRHKKRLNNLRNSFLKGISKVRKIPTVSYNELSDEQQSMYDNMELSLNKLEKNYEKEG